MKVSINELLENPEKVVGEDRCNLFCRDESLYNRDMKSIPKLRFLVEVKNNPEFKKVLQGVFG